MRTKVLLLTAALGAVGIGSAMAQTVYSVNAVGFVNLTLPAGFSLIANPLNVDTNGLNEVLPDGATPPVGDGTTIQKWDPAAQRFNHITTFYTGAGWLDETLSNPTPLTLGPGDGAFINMAAAGTVTFVGEVPQGNLSHTIPPHFSIISQLTPQAIDLVAGGLTVANDGDTVQFYDNTLPNGHRAYNQIFTSYGGTWYDSTLNPTNPVPDIGVAFFYNNTGSSVTWTRTFNVSP